ncbi:MAG: hypothetical protein A2V85_12180 [Chloroflexi bacterium RBG_16_72_14]|nr:MAG: hypothetical protein A2V85_12180 [Chloroflexi bacterium RBG_16_72_14]
MPFNAPWRDFEKGDLVYGIEGEWNTGRARFFTEQKLGDGPKFARIDDYPVLASEMQHMRGRRPPEAKAFVKALGGHPKYGGAVSGEDDNAAVRWKSKGGLYWAIMVDPGIHVHFVLDGIEQEAVVQKSYQGTISDVGAHEDPGKTRSVTGSELRWVYRNREHERVQERVQFWLKNKQCAPPWHGNGAPLWAQYQPRKDYNIHEDAAAGGANRRCCIVQ